MARLRRTSQVLESARQRLAGLKSINLAPNFGTALTLAADETLINGFGGKLGSYNQQVAALDDLQNGLETDEGSLRSKRITAPTAVSTKPPVARARVTRRKPTRSTAGAPPPPPSA